VEDNYKMTFRVFDFHGNISGVLSWDKAVYGDENSDDADAKIQIVRDFIVETSGGTRGSKYLSTTIAETQGSNQWCGAYCMAMLLNFRKSVSTYHASGIISSIYGNTNTSNHPTLSQLKTYASGESIAMVYTNNIVTIATAKSNINNNKPLIMNFWNYTLGTHALCLRGYNESSGLYSVWNPKTSSYETMNYSTTVYTDLDGKVWVWQQTLY